MKDRTIILRGGRVYQNGVLVDSDLLIRGERIAAVVGPGAGLSADEVVDVSDLAVLPGAIDTHTHTREPGYTHKEDFESATKAAAVGGVTTIVDMPNVEPPTDTVERFLEKREMASGRCMVDWGHWVAGTKPENIRGLAEAGATGYKIFQVSGAYPHDPRLAINEEGALMASFREISATGLPCLVHPFNQPIFDRLSQEAFDAGERPTGRLFSWIYTTDQVWSTAVETLLALQGLTGVRLHLLHTHAAGSLRAIRRAKRAGARVTAEIDPKYYHFTLQQLEEKGARMVPGGFVTEDEQRMEEIWRSLNDGTIDNISTDHAPHLLEEVALAEEDAWNANLGSPQIEWLYPVVLTDVGAGRHSLSTAVRLLAENPARLLGVWPRKGELRPGSDADIAVIDLERRFTVDESQVQTKVGWSPYAGLELQGQVITTFSRGEKVAENGDPVGPPGHGRYIPGRPQD